MKEGLKINEAISRLHLKTGKRMNFQDIARRISTPQTYLTTYQKVLRYASGNIKMFELSFVQLLAEVLETTPQFLLDIEEKEDENI